LVIIYLALKNRINFRIKTKKFIAGSWSYTSNCLNYTLLHEGDPSLKNFTDNSAWTLVKYKPTRFEIKYDHWFEVLQLQSVK